MGRGFRAALPLTALRAAVAALLGFATAGSACRAAGAPPPTPEPQAAESPAVAQAERPALSAGFEPQAPRGMVRIDGRAFADDDGPRPALGASLFWLAWGYRHDRGRLEANLRWLADRGVDFVRALGEVGGRGWEDRVVDPAWPDYVDVIRGATALANRHGLRVEWTIFGGGASRTTDEWRAAARRMVTALQPVAAGVQFVEVQNEQQGPPLVLAREIAAVVRRELGVEVAVTGTPERELAAVYAGSAATLATIHFDRQAGEDGWRFARQAWEQRDRAGLPGAFVNNEPAGIASSVRAENDPVRVASDALATWVAGGAAYVLHHGAGIHGRRWTHPTAGPRQADAWAQPALAEALEMIGRIRAVLPGDIANWSRAEHDAAPPGLVPPFRFAPALVGTGASPDLGAAGVFTALRGHEFYTVILGARGDLVTEATRPATATVLDLRGRIERPWTGRIAGTDSTYLVHGRTTAEAGRTRLNDASARRVQAPRRP